MDALVRRFCAGLTKESGLVFRMFWDFNQALLSKLAWWALSEKDCQCINYLCARQNWLNQPTPSGSSPIWKSLEGTKALIAQEACLLPGNGRSIRVWEDPWVPYHFGIEAHSKGRGKQRRCLQWQFQNHYIYIYIYI